MSGEFFGLTSNSSYATHRRWIEVLLINDMILSSWLVIANLGIYIVLHITDSRGSHEVTVYCVMFGITETIILYR